MMSFRKTIALFAALTLLAACGSGNRREAQRSTLEEYRQQVAELNTLIAELEEEMESDSAAASEVASGIPVKVKEMEAERFEHFIEVTGSLEAVVEAWISPETGGRIRSMLVKEGDRVSQGQVLARLNTDITESSIEEVKAQLELARVIFTKQQELWNQKIGSEVDFLQARTNKEALESRLKTMEAQLDQAVIRSPIRGIVEEVNQKVGELAAPGMMMMRIINMDELYVKADVAETHLPALREDEKVNLSFPTWPDLEMHPRIHRIGSAIHPLNRTVTVTMKVRNTPDHKLKPNLMANVRFMDYESDSALVVPSICIKQDINGSYLYRLRDEGGRQVAEKVYIKAAYVYHGQTLVTDGLQPGDRVIVAGYNLVTNGAEVIL